MLADLLGEVGVLEAGLLAHTVGDAPDDNKEGNRHDDEHGYADDVRVRARRGHVGALKTLALPKEHGYRLPVRMRTRESYLQQDT